MTTIQLHELKKEIKTREDMTNFTRECYNILFI